MNTSDQLYEQVSYFVVKTLYLIMVAIKFWIWNNFCQSFVCSMENDPLSFTQCVDDRTPLVF